ncbi:MAG TPA: hypothetical protein VNL71_20230, partial [Chloroflexota bacterium]|nr:hypothetical protein [Chloroflexota bacterium]
MAGPVAIDPGPRKQSPDFGYASERDLPAYLGVMGVIHREPINSAFARMVTGELEDQDVVPLAHVLEEVSVLARHHLVSEDLLFDAFAVDLYWDQLAEGVGKIRSKTNNPKFCENFENCAKA